jgi:DNA-directed RNA polymerase specialized sigma24 family protein
VPERETYTQLRIEGPEYGVSEIVERNIQKQDARVAHKARRPDLAKGLEQEARIRAWQGATTGEDTLQYLLANTRQAISDVMRSGTDVDRRPWPAYEREKVYGVWSLDYPVDEKHTTHGETLVDERLSVEEQALGLVMIAEIRRLQAGEEQEILEDRLEGYYQREIAENLGLRDRYAVRRQTRRIREKAVGYLGREGPL